MLAVCVLNDVFHCEQRTPSLPDIIDLVKDLEQIRIQQLTVEFREYQTVVERSEERRVGKECRL